MFNCSSEKTNVVSTTFHNTTAHYNAYYYANERINEIKAIVNEGQQDNYDEILKIYHPFDTALSSSYKTQTKDCIKKASLAIQMHGNSKWVDDSYILIGLARFYDSDFVNAIETFKYVNTKGKDPDARHEALAHLLRVFTEYKEYNNAVAVIDYLKKEELNPKNQKLLYLNKAHLYQVLEDYNKVVENLVLAAPLLSRAEGKARTYFIIGQIYQKLGFDSEAYNNYKACLANNPKYELFFYSKLNMAQVAELNKASDLRTTRKHFRQLLDDKKNREFKDKIYYEMAEFEIKNGNTDLSIEYYRASVASSINNNRQKGISYLKLGKIYYDTLKDYSIAKAYYDSTVQVLPKEYEGYEEINERKEVLDNFVEQLTTIQLQDSLLVLSEMDSTLLMSKINDIIEKEAQEKRITEEKAKKKAAQAAAYVSPFETNNKKGGASWYFGNPVAVSQGVSEFKRKWGNRNLEDHWRRASKTDKASDIVSPDIQLSESDNTPDKTSAEPKEVSADEKAAGMFSQIPMTADAKQKALDQIEEAYYNLGNIYHFDLKETHNAVESFETLLNRFSETEHEPEVRYLLYIIGNGNSEYHKNQLLDKFPKSTYAKLILNPNYTTESNETIAKLKVIYEDAYKLFKARKFGDCRTMLIDALNSHSETSFTPRLILLNIMLTAKLENADKYKYQLGEFIKEYPNHKIAGYAKGLEKSMQDYEDRVEKSKGIQYVTDFAQVHYFVMIYESKQNITDKVTEKLKAFNTENYEELELNTGSLSLNDDYSIALVTEFTGIEAAVSYLTKYDEGKQAFEILSNSKIDTFVITKDNFGILYKTGGVKEYLKFFSQYY